MSKHTPTTQEERAAWAELVADPDLAALAPRALAKAVPRLITDVEALRAQVERVREVHKATKRCLCGDALCEQVTPEPTCWTCLDAWPCATLRALDGEGEA